jgi:3-hydroxyisobutyrate dehydrogenase-like beta-hydroxyacid dehydrogenase
MNTKNKIGILFPGEMGVSVAFAVKNSGYEVYWTSEGRSRQTLERAQKIGLEDAVTLEKLCELCPTIISVCPPHLAEKVAETVLNQNFSGSYLDANAISPMRVKQIGLKLAAAGIAFTDGGIIGSPAWKPDSTWLYLSGKNADDTAELFSAGPLETAVIGNEIGKASALKMCYAANTKGTTALLCAILAAAEKLGVRQELQNQWSRHGSDYTESAIRRVTRATRKAWRFSGEMVEISATLSHAGVPGEFHAAAAETYRRLAGFKDEPAPVAIQAVLAAMLPEAD